MKKTYQTPEALIVALSTCQMMAESLVIYTNTSTDDSNPIIDDGNQILTKGKNSIWDEVW